MPVLKIAAALGTLFGALTILSGGRALFAGVDMGAVVPFVLWFNFLAGFVYVTAGVGLWLGRGWAFWLAGGLALATALVALAFAAQVLTGHPYEPRTIGALALRLAVWLWITHVARALIRPVN
ncbi:hypothetical protein [Shimia sp.]|uniref:hypothetical protein n=1 Tax=Shimia sp. TaxID=1954381 RepID=UPI003562A873